MGHPLLEGVGPLPTRKLGACVCGHSVCINLLQDFLPTAGPPLYTRNHCLSAMGGNILSLQVCMCMFTMGAWSAVSS